MALRAIATESQYFNNPSTTGKPGRDQRLDFKYEAGDTVFSIVSDADGTASIQGDAVPKVYRALLTQASTDDPTATVLENTLGGEVVWTRPAGGRYDATLAGAFTANKTAVNSGSCTDGSITLLGWFAGARIDADSVRVISSSINDPSSVSDDVLLNTYVEILVYP